MEQLFKKGNGGFVGGFTRDLALWPLLYPLFSLDYVHSRLIVPNYEKNTYSHFRGIVEIFCFL